MNDAIYLNQIQKRRLTNGKWILMAQSDAPIVVSDQTKKILDTEILQPEQFNQSFIDDLYENGFVRDGKLRSKPTTENRSHIWKFTRFILIGLGLVSSVISLILLFKIDFPTGRALLPKGIIFYQAIIFDLGVAVLTTILHEFMHMIFSQNISVTRLRLNFNKSVAKISMSDVWTWSLLGRFSAVTSGMFLDIFWLMCLSFLQIHLQNWMISAAISVLALRILWQLRVHKRCDGQLLLAMVTDDPFLREKMKKPLKFNLKIKLYSTIGHLVTLLIFIGWVIPIILRLLGWV